MENGFDEKIIWDVIDCYFRDNPQSLVRHHIESYNDFYKEDIFRIFKEMNPITIVSKYDEKTEEYKLKCNLCLWWQNWISNSHQSSLQFHMILQKSF